MRKKSQQEKNIWTAAASMGEYPDELRKQIQNTTPQLNA